MLNSFIKIKVRFWLSCLSPLVLLLPITLKLFGFPILRFWAYYRNVSCALYLIYMFLLLYRARERKYVYIFSIRFVRYGIYNPRIRNHFFRIINPCILFTNPFSLLNNWFPLICVNRTHWVISLVIRSLKLTFRSFTLLIRFHALLVCSPFH